MKEIECVTLSGQLKQVPSEALSFRPAVYAILVRDQKILLLKMNATGKYHLPGGGIEVSERIEETLHREVREETGIEIQVDRLGFFAELFFFYDPSGRAYHGLHFFYLCSPVTRNLIADEQVVDGSAGKPRWVRISDLEAKDFQHSGEKILAVCRQTS
jgi:8-oxo-dGTP pyrophosphatase MutT (NUDIX family)